MRRISKAIIFSLSFISLLLINNTASYAANIPLDKHLAKQYATNREKSELVTAGKDYFLEGAIARLGIADYSLSAPIRVYKLIDTNSFINTYNNKNKLTDYISKYYSFYQFIISPDDKSLGCIVYHKDSVEDLKNYKSVTDPTDKAFILKQYNKNKNKWYVSEINSGDYLEYFSNLSNIQTRLNSVGMNNIDNITLLEPSGVILSMIYVNRGNKEYSLPIGTEGSGYTTDNVYKLSDILDPRLKTAKYYLKNPVDLSKVAMGYNPPIQEPMLTPITKVPPYTRRPLALIIVFIIIGFACIILLFKCKASILSRFSFRKKVKL
ncbi:MAG TPA: hypothetical protein VIK72_10265 [Clostridiaceae bacterium]